MSHSTRVIGVAIRLRKSGKTHREIAKELGVGLGSAWLWTKNVRLTTSQKSDILKRRSRKLSRLTREKFRQLALKNLVPRLNRYTKEDLIKKIQDFYKDNGRIPLKREFNMHDEYKRRFGSWNAAVRVAGFAPNPITFSFKFKAKDGHACDSFSEKVIDDHLLSRKIPHERNVPYPENAKFKADFSLGANVFVEFFGLSGEINAYDRILKKKRDICLRHKINLTEIYPRDLYETKVLPDLVEYALSVS